MRSHDLVEIGGRKGCGLAGYYDDGVAPDNGGSKEGDKSQERVIVRTCYSNHTNWLIYTNCAPIQSRLLWGRREGVFNTVYSEISWVKTLCVNFMVLPTSTNKF